MQQPGGFTVVNRTLKSKICEILAIMQTRSSAEMDSLQDKLQESISDTNSSSPQNGREASTEAFMQNLPVWRAVEKPDSPPSTHPLSNIILLKSVLKLVRHAALVIWFDLRIWRDQMYSGEWLQKIARNQLPDRATFAPCLDS